MNEDIPIELQDFDFPELTNNQVNIWRLRDELNATRRWLRENTVDVDEEEMQESSERQLKPGVSITKNGRFVLQGKGFIKESEAYQ